MNNPAVFGVGVAQSRDNPTEPALLVLVDIARAPHSMPDTLGGLRVRYMRLHRFHVTQSKYSGVHHASSCALKGLTPSGKIRPSANLPPMISRPFRRIELPSALRAFLGQCSLPAIGQCLFLSGNARFNAEREEDREDRSALSVSPRARLRTRIFPLCLLTISALTHRPRPVPVASLVVKNGSKMRRCTPGDMPDRYRRR